jgi:hypothetical protein
MLRRIRENILSSESAVGGRNTSHRWQADLNSQALKCTAISEEENDDDDSIACTTAIIMPNRLASSTRRKIPLQEVEDRYSKGVEASNTTRNLEIFKNFSARALSYLQSNSAPRYHDCMLEDRGMVGESPHFKPAKRY